MDEMKRAQDLAHSNNQGQRISDLEKDLDVEKAINQARMKLNNQDDVVKLYHGAEVERLKKELEMGCLYVECILMEHPGKYPIARGWLRKNKHR
ncbi:MAG: hypothetical protein V3V74_07735 [Nitrosomonadaceae bacterium]